MANDTQAPEVVAAPEWELVQVGEYKKVDGKDTSVRVEKGLFTGTEGACYGAFHRVCPFSYMNHRQYSYDTYTIRPIKAVEESEK